MFLIMTKYRRDIIILIITSILVGSILVAVGGLLTDRYFSGMVSGMIGDYGEYDLLIVLSSEKKEIALEQVKRTVKDVLPGSELEKGPEVAGSSNYLLKLPDSYKNEETYVNLGEYFSGIPGLMSTNIMSEPRLSVRGFRGNTLSEIRKEFEKIEGIDFLYSSSDGLDIIVEEVELLSEVKNEIDEILEEFQFIEVRYPLDQHPENIEDLEANIYRLLEGEADKIINVTGSNESEQLSLLKSLEQMKTFLTSYATKVIIDTDLTEGLLEGSSLVGRRENKSDLHLEVLAADEDRITALINEESGDLDQISDDVVEVYNYNSRTGESIFIGEGRFSNPRQQMILALENLNEVTPALNSFLEQSNELLIFTENLDQDFENLNQALMQLKENSSSLGSSLQEWEEEGLSNFLEELLLILDQMRVSLGDISVIQKELIQTSNSLKEGARMIEEKIIFVPTNNSVYQQLSELRGFFLQLANALDNNYDVVEERLQEMDPVFNSLDSWEDKVHSLLRVENSLTGDVDWNEMEKLMTDFSDNMDLVESSELQEKLAGIQEMFMELKTSQLPQIMDQLAYIRDSLPELKESEIIETINLIDSYMAGHVIPGDQIQFLIKGEYNPDVVKNKVWEEINNPAVTYFEMNAGNLQPNPRGEIFNILSQVRAVVSIFIAFVFTVLIMVFDHTLIISVLRLNGSRGYLYSFINGSLLFSSIYYLSGVSFPYMNLQIALTIGGLVGLIVAFLSGMINPVSKEEWEAGKSLGFSPRVIMQEIIVPSGKPGLLYLLNYKRIMLK